LRAGGSKQIKVMVRGKETKKYENIDFNCETVVINQTREVEMTATAIKLGTQ
jgi:hypothetical protein